MSANSRHDRLLAIATVSLIVCGAALLFWIQPVIGQLLTPYFGGSAQVWCVLLVFFQSVVLMGYGLAALLDRLPHQKWIMAMGALWVMGLLVLVLVDHTPREIDPDQSPWIQLLEQLFTGWALPLIMVATLSPTMQRLEYRWRGTPQPYWLYGLSNLASLSILLAYPLLLEPWVGVSGNLELWMYLYYVAAGLMLVTLAVGFKVQEIGQSEEQAQETEKNQDISSVTWKNAVQWVFWSAMGSALLVSYTQHLTRDVAPVPLLWVLPLVIFLLSFVVAFRWDHGSLQKTWRILAFIGASQAMRVQQMEPMVAVTLYLVILATYCMVCHTHLYQSRPHPAKLPVFYWWISVGGVLGGLLVSVVAPLTLDGVYEWLWLQFILMLAILLELMIPVYQRFNLPAKISWPISIGLAVLVLKVPLAFHYFPEGLQILAQERNFYGAIAVTEDRETGIRQLSHGITTHGAQLLESETGKLSQELTSYYTAYSGAGKTFELWRQANPDKPMSVGIIGLGVGVLTPVLRAGDVLEYYELDPAVVEIANEWFTYLRAAPEQVKVIVGDGRFQMKTRCGGTQDGARYDIILLDAFNSDAIPVHLLSQEAWALYTHCLKPDGLLLTHISNRYLDLTPVLISHAQHNQWPWRVLDHKLSESSHRGYRSSRYFLMGPLADQLPENDVVQYPGSHFTIHGSLTPAQQKKVDEVLWTDDSSPIWPLLGDRMIRFE